MQTHENEVSATKDDHDNKSPDLLNRVVQETKPNYVFTKLHGLVSLSVICK